MKINIASSDLVNSQEAISEIISGIKDFIPEMMIVYGTVEHDYRVVTDQLKAKFPDAKLAGSTSCMGIMTSKGFISNQGSALGVMALKFENEGSFGVGMSHLDDPEACAREACKKSLVSVERDGELPSFIWIMCSPGQEEAYIKGIESYIGSSVAIYGGSCADNDLSGKWKLFTNDDLISTGIVVVSFFSSEFPQILSSFHCGYEATKQMGKITKVVGREILEIDGMPASSVYNEWAGGILADKKVGENILGVTSYFPLGRKKGEIQKLPYYLLSHPSSVTENGGLNLFTEMEVNETVCLMSGSIESLKRRAGEVAKSIFRSEGLEQADISGALVVYCAGCMLTVNSENQMNEVAKGLKEILGDIPFMGVFTFGEQGCLIGETNLHGNLMISVTLFLASKR